MRIATVVGSLALVAVTLMGCGDGKDPMAAAPTDGEQAQQALEQMLDVAEQGDWSAYVVRFYGEQEKFGSSADREALVQRFATRWGEKVLAALRRASALAPRLEGDQAIFEDDQGTAFVLHRGTQGAWTFHL